MALPYKRVCPSHRAVHEGNATGRFGAFLSAFHRQRNEALASICSGKTLDELVSASPFYKNRFFDLKIQNYFEEHMIAENLSLLIEEGLVREDGGVYYSL